MERGTMEAALKVRTTWGGRLQAHPCNNTVFSPRAAKVLCIQEYQCIRFSRSSRGKGRWAKTKVLQDDLGNKNEGTK